MTDISNAIHALAGHSPIADGLARFAADYLVYFAVLVLAWLYFRQRSVRTFLVASVAAALAVGSAGVIGLVDYVPRPFVAEHFTPLIQHASDASFPSDHLAALGAICAATWFAAPRLSIATGVMALAVAVARVYVGVHWVTDVIAGFGLGVIWGVFAWYASGLMSPGIEAFDQRLRRWRVRPNAGG